MIDNKLIFYLILLSLQFFTLIGMIVCNKKEKKEDSHRFKKITIDGLGKIKKYENLQPPFVFYSLKLFLFHKAFTASFATKNNELNNSEIKILKKYLKDGNFLEEKIRNYFTDNYEKIVQEITVSPDKWKYGFSEGDFQEIFLGKEKEKITQILYKSLSNIIISDHEMNINIDIKIDNMHKRNGETVLFIENEQIIKIGTLTEYRELFMWVWYWEKKKYKLILKIIDESILFKTDE